MGGAGCCQTINKEALKVKSKEEIFIRETINYYSSKICKLKEINNLMDQCFSSQLLDIEGPPLDWITEESYNDFIRKIFNINSQNHNKKSTYLKYIKLPYDNLKNITAKEYKSDKFHLLLCIWLVGISSNESITINEKMQIIKEIILKCDKYITFQTFSKFIETFLEIMLIEVTKQFMKHNEIEVENLLDDVYSSEHIEEFCKWLCSKMGKIISKNKKQILTDTTCLNNEYIKDDQLNEFFNLCPFLLQPKELRSNFYNKYTFQ